VRVAMEKVPGVASVRVSLNEGLTVLELKPENAVTLSNLRQIIRNNGFVTKEARVTARGSVNAVSGQLILEVTGSRERLILSPAPGSSTSFDDLRVRLNASAPIDVVLSGAADLTDPKALKMTVFSIQSP
jgi:copper chaperone CopZ